MCLRYAAVLILAVAPLTAQDSFSAKEAALGKQLATEFRSRTSAIDSPAVQSYLDRLGEKIASGMAEARLPFALSAFTGKTCGPTHEPAALPAGYVFVPADLFVAAKDEAEFAGMLAHAMEHVVQYRRRLSKSTPLVFAGGWGGGCRDAQDVPPKLRAQERVSEMDADVLAVERMAQAGFDPASLVHYLEQAKLPTDAAARERDQRVSLMQSRIERISQSTFSTSSEFGSVQQEVRRIMEQRAASAHRPSLLGKN